MLIYYNNQYAVYSSLQTDKTNNNWQHDYNDQYTIYLSLQQLFILSFKLGLQLGFLFLSILDFY